MKIFLSDRCLIKIKGKDSLKFLQNLTTNDVNKLSKEKPVLNTLFLNPKGKILAEGSLLLNNDVLYLETCKTRLFDLLNHFRRYQIRKDVSFEEEKSLHICKYINNNKIDNLDKFDLFSGDVNEIKENENNESLLKLNIYKKFVLNIFQSNFTNSTIDSFPYMYNFDKRNYIDYKKGCYLGQEITQRTFFTGKINKRFMGINLPKEESEKFYSIDLPINRSINPTSQNVYNINDEIIATNVEYAFPYAYGCAKFEVDKIVENQKMYIKHLDEKIAISINSLNYLS